MPCRSDIHSANASHRRSLRMRFFQPKQTEQTVVVDSLPTCPARGCASPGPPCAVAGAPAGRSAAAGCSARPAGGAVGRGEEAHMSNHSRQWVIDAVACQAVVLLPLCLLIALGSTPQQHHSYPKAAAPLPPPHLDCLVLRLRCAAQLVALGSQLLGLRGTSKLRWSG